MEEVLQVLTKVSNFADKLRASTSEGANKTSSWFRKLELWQSFSFQGTTGKLDWNAQEYDDSLWHDDWLRWWSKGW